MGGSSNLLQHQFCIEPSLQKRAVPLILASVARVDHDDCGIVAAGLLDLGRDDLIEGNHLKFVKDIVDEERFCKAEGTDDLKFARHLKVETLRDLGKFSIAREFMIDRMLGRIARPELPETR